MVEEKAHGREMEGGKEGVGNKPGKAQHTRIDSEKYLRHK
jgi:hypothetical protein